jgi:formylglycine-generating enzyme required for sulfatase activity/lysophospholipase L1-like esterase
MVDINGGIFIMGLPDEASTDIPSKQHEVTVSSFSISKYEITQKQFESVMGYNTAPDYNPDLPINFINWYDAVKYCNKLSELQGLTPCYTITPTAYSDAWEEGVYFNYDVTWDKTANGYRLPTEAEWEYACRAGTTTLWYLDVSYSSIWRYANCNDMSLLEGGIFDGVTKMPGYIVVGGSFAPNPWGLYDMMGNVGEWCWDWYEPITSSNSLINPTGPETVQADYEKVWKGGSYLSNVLGLRSGNRGMDTPFKRYRGNGIRVVRGIPEEAPPIPSVSLDNAAVLPLKPTLTRFPDFHQEVLTNYQSQNNYDVVFIGDSRIDQLRTVGANTWLEISDEITGDAINLGFGNDTTANVLWRIENGEWPDSLKPKYCIIECGVNNNNSGIGKGAESIAAGIGRICATIHFRSPSTKILLLPVVPEEGNDFAAVNALIAKYDGFWNIKFMNILDVFINQDGSLNTTMYNADGVHFTAIAYEKLWTEIKGYIRL